MRMNERSTWPQRYLAPLARVALGLGLSLILAAGLLSATKAQAGAADGFSDGTIPISLQADDLAVSAGAADDSAIRSMVLAEQISHDGMLDEALLVERQVGATSLYCLAADEKNAGQFITSARSSVTITGICRSQAGAWTIAGIEKVSGDHYLVKGEVSVARDGTIAFAGTVFRSVGKKGLGEPQSLGNFSLSDR